MIWKLLGSNRGASWMTTTPKSTDSSTNTANSWPSSRSSSGLRGEPGSDLDALLDQLDAELTHHTETRRRDSSTSFTRST